MLSRYSRFRLRFSSAIFKAANLPSNVKVMKSNDPQDADLKRLLAAPITDEPTVQQVLVALRNHKALDESRQQLLQVAKEARSALGPLPINDATGALMSLCDAVIDRSA